MASQCILFHNTVKMCVQFNRNSANPHKQEKQSAKDYVELESSFNQVANLTPD